MHPSAFQPGRTAPIGALDKRITIQQAVTTQDAVGGQVMTWSDVATVWAHVHPLAGRELINAQSVYAEVTHNMVIRWQSQFNDPQTVAKMRVSYSGRRYNIGAAIHLEEGRRFIVLSCAEGLSDG